VHEARQRTATSVPTAARHSGIRIPAVQEHRHGGRTRSADGVRHHAGPAAWYAALAHRSCGAFVSHTQEKRRLDLEERKLFADTGRVAFSAINRPVTALPTTSGSSTKVGRVPHWVGQSRGERGIAEQMLTWIEGAATDEGYLPEQLQDHVQSPYMLAYWRQKWGSPQRLCCGHTRCTSSLRKNSTDSGLKPHRRRGDHVLSARPRLPRRCPRSGTP